jgi:hypothetical protein
MGMRMRDRVWVTDALGAGAALPAGRAKGITSGGGIPRGHVGEIEIHLFPKELHVSFNYAPGKGTGSSFKPR